MRVRHVAQAGALGFFVMVLVAAAPAAQAQAQPPPPSLRVDLGELFITSGANLQNGTEPAAGPCGPGASTVPNAAPPSANWAFALPFNGSWHMRDPAGLTLALGSPTAGGAATAGAQPLAVLARVSGSGNPAEDTQTLQGPTAPAQVAFAFAPNATAPLNATSGTALQLHVEFAQTTGWNIRAQCGQNSKLGPVVIYRGAPGDGDFDGDGIPNTEDLDRDGDGAPNTSESGTCAFFDPPIAYADDGRIRPGNDTDGDGYNDEVECGASPASNPTDRSSIPAQPRTILEILLPWILLLIVLAILAAIVFLFLRFGRTVAVTIVSQPELFIPPGSKGKYEVAAQSLVKKGEPRTFQLAVAGMPEGWDAKLNVDHVTLEPQGGATNRQTVWLEVEAPTHTEPESAVVSVKAVPLNKAGRKDTFKLPGRAETITSINVPPGSKVPVKRGGKIEAAAPAEAGPVALPLDQLGVEPAAAKKLGVAGVKDSEQLRTADAAALAKKTKLPEEKLASWQSVADLVRLGMTPEQAAALAAAGIGSIGALSQADPAGVAAKASVDEKTGKGWVKAAGKFLKKSGEAAPEAPAAAPAAAPAPAAGAPKPQLQVGGLRHEPAAFHQGDPVKSIVNVANGGKDPNTIKLSLYVNDGLADVQTVTVKGGKSKEVQFKWTAQEKNKLNIRGEIVPG